MVLNHIKADLSPALNAHQYVYRSNRLTDDAITTTLHTVLHHLEQPGTYVLLFVDYSSAFNTILPSKLLLKMSSLGIQHNSCLWIKDLLTNRPQSVRMGYHHSSTLTLSAESLSLLPVHTIVPRHIIPMPLLNLQMTWKDESAYREEVQGLTAWCRENNLTLNIKKTKELIIDFRKNKEVHTPLHINGEEVERVASFKFLGISHGLLIPICWSKRHKRGYTS